ncbi:MAG: SDR family oxidoreductase [candidate division NC10 bacterium]|nr:SDR family oxidoreductase [candidate division NC10 bacterium]
MTAWPWQRGRSPTESCSTWWRADLTHPGCSLAEATMRRLRATVETVIHCAGDPTFFPESPLAFRVGHMDGPLALLYRLRGGRLRQWAHLSTAYVCGRRTGTVLEQEGDVGQEFHNPYEQVKLEAETALRRAGDRQGVDVRVFRPSIVVGAAPETAGGCPSNLFFRFIRLMATIARLSNGADVPLRIAAAPRAGFHLVPVETVAAALVALADHPAAAGETCHLVVSNAPTQEAVLAIITGRLGLRGPRLLDARQTPFTHPSPLERKVERMLSGYREYLEQDVHFDDRIARRLLRQCGIEPPTLGPKAVQELIDLAIGAPALREADFGERPGAGSVPAPGPQMFPGDGCQSQQVTVTTDCASTVVC